jgi:DNA-binding GntR family transcriptional regulator
VGIRESIVHYGGRRICLMVSWHPAAMCDLVPSLVDPEPIPEGTIGAVMAAGTRYGDQDQHLVARGASKREAGLLQIEHETPVLAVVSLRVSSDDTPIEYLECVYAPGVVLSV